LGGIGNWQCTAYDTLANLNCSLGSGLFLPVVKQVNGVFTCAEEADTFAYLQQNCTAGQTIKYVNGVWTCASDIDTFRNLQLTCVSGDTLQWNGNAFVCASSTIFADSDILGALTCANAQVARFDSTLNTFVCSNDFNTLPTGCTSNGQVAIWNGSIWTCTADSDYLRQVGIQGCGGTTPFLKYRNGQRICTDQYFVLRFIGEPGFLTYLQTANILYQEQSATPVPVTNYTVLWGSIAQTTLFSNAAPVFPFNGTITSAYILLQNFQSAAGAVVALDFAVSGVSVSGSINFSVSPSATPATYFYLSPVFTGQTFQAGETVSLGLRVISGELSTSPFFLSSIYVAVYISVSI
jgi:hypothetical protein